jgi:putative Holliday junction resolvase
MNRIMAIDWGEKRLGIAVTDPLNLTAQPLTVIPNTKNSALWDTLQKLTKEYQVKKIVVGIPVMTNGIEGEKANKVRNWIKEAQKKLNGIDFAEIDERFTTAHAKRILQEVNIKPRRQKNTLDSIAASLILQHYLEIHSMS